MSPRVRGFTLVELMIVVAIVGILAAVAYPGYQEHIRKSRRAECAGVVAGISSAMERRFSTTNSYAGPLPGPAQCPAQGGGLFYNLGFAAGEPTVTTFVIQAVPAGPQAADKCGTLTLDNVGQKGQKDGLTVRECW